MKKSFYIITAATLSLVACSRNQEVDVPDANLSIFARTESPAETKTVVESGVHVYWEPGDEIAVFTGEQSAKFTTDITAASGTATFKGTFGDATWPEDIDLWAVYPFSEDAVFDGETITTTLPSEQVAREGSFGKDMNLAIAHSNSSTLQFYNVGGGIRFSVTEEGIKKVMFEGLSGELISGKVKIGFEDGLPVVKEVTGGSQFITLLPPTGQETFEPGVWYYIVAIPGSLEGGYKLRFYKDSDYARKVSEKAVTIKRSIFGNIEKADEGIEYEETTTHFPETEDEWEESERSISLVGEQVQAILKNLSQSDDNQVIEQIENIEGVLRAYYKEDGTVSIMQKDSLWVYFFPKDHRKELKGLEITENGGVNSNAVSTQNGPRLHSIRNNAKENKNANNKALILAPYFGSASAKIKEYLMDCGFQEDNIHIKKDTSANILLFKGSNLQQYKYVFIDTHGGIGYFVDDPDTSGVENQTVFLSGTRFSARRARHYQLTKQLTRDQIAVSYEEEDDYRFCMNTAFISSTDFSSTEPLFFLGACHSAEIENNLQGGSMVGTLLSNHAGAIAGYSDVVAENVNSAYAKYVLLFMSKGFSFQNASKYWKDNETFEEYCASGRYYLSDPSVWEEDDIITLSKLSEKARDGRHIDKSLYRYYPKQPENEYFFVDPIPELNNPTTAIMGQTVQFTWECDLKPFELDFGFTQYKDGQGAHYSKKFTYVVKYEIYVDDSRLGKTLYTDDTDKKASWNPSSVGKHTWYVVGKIMEGDSVLASYQSEKGEFYVKEPGPVIPEIVDLGLPSGLKWASFNLGATKPEEYGDYYAWGETEPYYVSKDPLIWKEGKEEGYSWASYKWSKWSLGSGYIMTKYCSNPNYGSGFMDNKYVLDFEDDAAFVCLGDKWRIPTKSELDELRDECTWVWTTMNGIDGWMGTGPNGNSVFFPAAGQFNNAGLSDYGWSGFLWTSSLDNTENRSDCSFALRFFSDSMDWNLYFYRSYGFPIRPVYGDSATPVSSVSLNKTELELSHGESSTLVATVLPDNATDKSVSWSSSDESVATVSSTGIVTGVAAGSAVITVTTSDGGKTATCSVTVKDDSPTLSVPEAVDLGLPSGLKWASFNLGASKPEEFGDYYAWGETEPYYTSLDPLTWKDGKEAGYTWDSYKWCKGSSTTLTKYCTNDKYGYNDFTDGKTVLDLEDDAAHVNLGGTWRMPTDAEFAELIDNCTWEWTTMNGVFGRKATSKKPGDTDKYIFLPAAGYRENSTLYWCDSNGYYWSSTCHSAYSRDAWLMHFSSSYVSRGSVYRIAGKPVRPVSE